MNDKVFLTINKTIESKILEKALNCKSGCAVTVADSNGQQISIVGPKRGGVEGGAIISLQNRSVSVSSEESTDHPPVHETKYVAKVMFKKDDIKLGRYSTPNAKDQLRSLWGSKTIKEINISVMQEYVALKLARIMNPEIVPDAKLGEVIEDSGQKRFFLMTELAGQKIEEEFKTFDNARDAEISKDMWKAAFAISVGLLNDQDVNKGDNVGVVSVNGESPRLCLFDLGHPTPDKFELDPSTCLPKSTSLLADVLLWLINIFVSASSIPGTFTMVPDIENKLTPEERKEALFMVLEKKDAILGELDRMIEALGENSTSKQAVRELKDRINKRMEYLEGFLQRTTKSAGNDSPGNPS
jgi:hypothetical protein